MPFYKEYYFIHPSPFAHTYIHKVRMFVIIVVYFFNSSSRIKAAQKKKAINKVSSYVNYHPLNSSTKLSEEMSGCGCTPPPPRGYSPNIMSYIGMCDAKRYDFGGSFGLKFCYRF